MLTYNQALSSFPYPLSILRYAPSEWPVDLTFQSRYELSKEADSFSNLFRNIDELCVYDLGFKI